MIVCWPRTSTPMVLPNAAWWRSLPTAPPGSVPASDQIACLIGPICWAAGT